MNAKSRRSRWQFGAAALVALVVGACDVFSFVPTSTGTVVDGFPVGPTSNDCGMTGIVSDGPVTWTCDAWHEMVRAQLDRVDPSHPPVIAEELHSTDYLNTDFFPDGPPTLGAGPFMIMVLKLEDGTARAFEIGCSPGGCGVSDDPPAKPGEEVSLCHPDTTKYNQCEEIISIARAELDVIEPGHPEILNTLLDTKNSEAQYVVEFYTSNGLMRDIPVECTEQGCVVGPSSP